MGAAWTLNQEKIGVAGEEGINDVGEAASGWYKDGTRRATSAGAYMYHVEDLISAPATGLVVAIAST